MATHYQWRTSKVFEIVLAHIPGCEEHTDEINQQIQAIHMGLADWVF